MQDLQQQSAMLQKEYEYEKELYRQQTREAGIPKRIQQGVCWLSLIHIYLILIYLSSIIFLFLSVDVRNDIVQWAADSDQVGNFVVAGEQIDYRYQRKTRRTEFHPVREFISVAFDIYTEFSPGGFDTLDVYKRQTEIRVEIENGCQNLVFTEKSGKRRNSRYGQTSDEEDVYKRQFLFFCLWPGSYCS